MKILEDKWICLWLQVDIILKLACYELKKFVNSQKLVVSLKPKFRYFIFLSFMLYLGSDAVTAQIGFNLFALGHRQNYQDKVYEEIRKVLGIQTSFLIINHESTHVFFYTIKNRFMCSKNRCKICRKLLTKRTVYCL